MSILVLRLRYIFAVSFSTIFSGLLSFLSANVSLLSSLYLTMNERDQPRDVLLLHLSSVFF